MFLRINKKENKNLAQGLWIYFNFFIFKCKPFFFFFNKVDVESFQI